jgi:hypothetical protein
MNLIRIIGHLWKMDQILSPEKNSVDFGSTKKLFLPFSLDIYFVNTHFF